jgi:hypothetical protein
MAMITLYSKNIVKVDIFGEFVKFQRHKRINVLKKNSITRNYKYTYF